MEDARNWNGLGHLTQAVLRGCLRLDDYRT
jgi:hypothetical protein